MECPAPHSPQLGAGQAQTGRSASRATPTVDPAHVAREVQAAKDEAAIRELEEAARRAERAEDWAHAVECRKKIDIIRRIARLEAAVADLAAILTARR